MLLSMKIILRAMANDGRAILSEEFEQWIPVSQFNAIPEGLGIEERSVNLNLMDLHIDSFKGKKATEAFYGAIDKGVRDLTARLSQVTESTFLLARDAGVTFDIAIKTIIDDDFMDLTIPSELLIQMARLQLSVSLTTDPEG